MEDSSGEEQDGLSASDGASSDGHGKDDLSDWSEEFDEEANADLAPSAKKPVSGVVLPPSHFRQWHSRNKNRHAFHHAPPTTNGDYDGTGAPLPSLHRMGASFTSTTGRLVPRRGCALSRCFDFGVVCIALCSAPTSWQLPAVSFDVRPDPAPLAAALLLCCFDSSMLCVHTPLPPPPSCAET